MAVSKRVINLTPHEVNVRGEAGWVAIPATGDVARVTSQTEHYGTLQTEGGSIPLTRSTFGEIAGLPEPRDGVFLLVSRVVAAAAAASGRDTSDLLVPGNLIRDEQGRVVGAESLELQ